MERSFILSFFSSFVNEMDLYFFNNKKQKKAENIVLCFFYVIEVPNFDSE